MYGRQEVWGYGVSYGIMVGDSSTGYETSIVSEYSCQGQSRPFFLPAGTTWVPSDEIKVLADL